MGDGQPLSLFTPQSLKEAEAAGEFDVDSNLLGLKPDPVRLVRFLKEIDRSDVSSDLFVQLLEAYRDSRTQKDSDPVKYVFIPSILDRKTYTSLSGRCCIYNWFYKFKSSYQRMTHRAF